MFSTFHMQLKQEKNAPVSAGRSTESDGGGNGKAEMAQGGGDGAKQADSLQSCPAVVRTERVKAQRCWGSSGVALLSFLASRITALPCQDLEKG